MSSTDDQALARDLAAEAGRRLLDLRTRGGDPEAIRTCCARPATGGHTSS
jgi:hypothetical protein